MTISLFGFGDTGETGLFLLAVELVESFVKAEFTLAKMPGVVFSSELLLGLLLELVVRGVSVFALVITFDEPLLDRVRVVAVVPTSAIEPRLEVPFLTPLKPPIPGDDVPEPLPLPEPVNATADRFRF